MWITAFDLGLRRRIFNKQVRCALAKRSNINSKVSLTPEINAFPYNT